MDDKNLNQEIDNFLDAAVKGIGVMDPRTFRETVSWDAYDPLIAKSWTRRILKMVDDCEAAGLTPKEIAELFPTMSQLRCATLFDLEVSKYTDISRSDREKIFQFYSSLLKVQALEDPYALAKNVIHSEEEIQDFLSQVKPATPDIAKKLGKLVNVCYHLGHALYTDMNCATVYENYGPYDVSDKYGSGHIVAIKEFGNLRPKDFWPEAKVLPCDFIQIVCVYKDVEMTVDSCSHAVYQGDLINNLKYFGLKIDNRDYSIEKLDEIREPIGRVAIEVFQKFQKLDLEKKKETYYFTKAYVYKKLYERLGQDWRPGEEILAEARGKELYQINYSKDKEKQKIIIRKALDPRIDFKA